MTLLFVARDPAYYLVTRNLRGSCPRDQWESPAGRREALRRAIPVGIHAVQSDGPHEYVAPVPVVLVIDPTTRQVVYAEISLPGRRERITPYGRRLSVEPVVAGAIRWRTTYLSWCEGPLPHVELMDHDRPPELPQTVQRLRHQNRALRERIDAAIGDSHGVMPREPSPERVDFRFRLIFKCPDYHVLVSKQGGDSKVVTSDGVIESAEPVLEV